MYRSFTKRIFGGVCGGLSNATPINAWLWRILFIVLTLLTLGAAAAVYILLWWLWPLDSPIRHNTGGLLPGLSGIILSIGLLVAWFLRGRLGLEDTYWIGVVLLLALVFLLKQIFGGRWQNIALGIVVLAVPLVFLLRNFGVLSGGLADISLRAWPALLVFLGLSVALRYRIRFGTWLALILSVGLVAGLASYAYNSRVDAPAINDPLIFLRPNADEDDGLGEISPNITTIQIVISSRDTDVTISGSEDDTRVVRSEFVGSRNSEIRINYEEGDDIALMSIQEVAVDEFPSLEDIGRGDLRIEIPTDIGVAVNFSGQRARELTFDMAALDLEQLIFEVDEGNVLVVLPQYQALSPSVQESNGQWRVDHGNLRVQVPQTVGARFLLDRNINPEPNAGQTYDDLIYRVELEGNDYVLVARQFDTQEIKMRYRIDVPNGSLRIENTGN